MALKEASAEEGGGSKTSSIVDMTGLPLVKAITLDRVGVYMYMYIDRVGVYMYMYIDRVGVYMYMYIDRVGVYMYMYI